AEGYATVVQHAWHRHGLRTLLTGGGTTQEREMGERIQSLCEPGSVIDAIGGTSLKGLLAMIARSRAVIAPDSGPVHMANALNTPVLGLYATSNVRRTGPYQWQDHALNVYPEAVRSYLHKPLEEIAWGQRVRHPDAMSLIHSEDVIERLEALFDHIAAIHMERELPDDET
ncbi:MAG: glycosyltransferase family 9 protein, partial [Halomonas sp.]